MVRDAHGRRGVAESRGITDAMVTLGNSTGEACFDVPFSFSGAQVTVDYGSLSNAFAMYRKGTLTGSCPAATDATVYTALDNGDGVNAAFHIEFYE